MSFAGKWMGLKIVTLLKISQVLARHWWLTPVILATQEAEMRRILV
jgi:hypothetical protein